MVEGRSEYAIRPLPASEQFAMRSCTYYLRGAARERL